MNRKKKIEKIKKKKRTSGLMHIREKDISMFLSLCALICILPIGWGIRYYYDRQEYDYLGITIWVAIFFIWLGKKFMGESFAKENTKIQTT